MNEETQTTVGDESVSEASVFSKGEKKGRTKGANLFGGIAIVALLGAALAWFLGRPSHDPSVSGGAKTGGAGAGNAVMNARKTTQYIDGAYTAQGAYQSPAGNESVAVTVTLKDNVISAVSSVGGGANPKSAHFQQLFSDGISSVVTGKSINDVSLTVVNGSSLTPRGFMDALNKIEQQAQKI